MNTFQSKGSSEIEEFVKSRGILNLFHFTNVVNLNRIFFEGLRSRSYLDQAGTGFQYNDEHRFDNRRDYISLSIEHPNSRMFSKYRHEEQSANWAVIVIDASVLWKKHCLFCKTNAACTSMSCLSENDLSSANALASMFVDDGSRDSRRLMSCDPTDDQAEVLVKGVIESSFFRDVIFNNENMYKAFKGQYPNGSFYYRKNNKSVFASRSYIREWNNQY